MKVREIMTRDVEHTNPDATLHEAAQRMREMDVGSLPVCDNDQLVGMLTDRDITVRAVAEGNDPRIVLVGQVMSPEMVTCTEDDSVEDAAEIMKHQMIRRLVVVNHDHRITGIVSLGDIALQADEDLAGESLKTIAEPIEAPTFNQSTGVLDNPTDRVQIG